MSKINSRDISRSNSAEDLRQRYNFDLLTKIKDLSSDSSNSDNLAVTIGNLLYPVGSIYTNLAVDTDPSKLLGFGKWHRINGRILVGVDETQTEINTLSKTGGDKNHMAHITWFGSTSTPPNRIYTNMYDMNKTFTPNYVAAVGTSLISSIASSPVNYPTKVTGLADTTNAMPPYITCYMWKRVA